MTIEELKARFDSGASISSYAATAFPSPPRPQRLPLASDEALVVVTQDAMPAWEVAGRLQAPSFVLVTPSRACLFDHYLTLGLFAITAGPSDFYARLVSRATALPGMPPQGPIDLRLLADTAHHAARAIPEHVGHRLTEAEKATLVERLWRATQLARTPSFVAREEEFSRMQQLARGQNVTAIWGEPQSHITGGEVARAVSDRHTRVGYLALFRRDGAFARSYSPAAWNRVAHAEHAAVLFASRTSHEESTFAALDTLSSSPEVDVPEVSLQVLEAALATSDIEPVLRLVEESLSEPIPPLLSPLFLFVENHRVELEARCTEAGRALLSLCDSTELHDDDHAWRALSMSLLQAPENEQVYHANALAHRLGLFA